MGSTQDKYRILKHLDAPEMYLFWSHDEAIVLFAPIVIGLIADCFLIGLIMGPVCLIGLKRIKNNFGDKALYHAFYWYVEPPHGHSLKATPPSYKREFYG